MYIIYITIKLLYVICNFRWSYGILLYEIITFGSSPYPTLDRLDTILPILKSGYRMPRPKYCSEEL